MTVQYLTDTHGKKTGVLLSIKDWEKIQKKLNTEQLYEDFRESLREIKLHKEGKIKLKVEDKELVRLMKTSVKSGLADKKSVLRKPGIE